MWHSLFSNDWFLIGLTLGVSLAAAYAAYGNRRVALLLRRGDSRQWTRWVAIAAAAYVVYFSAISLLQFRALNVHFDLALFDQVVWNTWGGKLAWTGLKHECFFREHFVPFFVLIAPLSALTPGPHYLLVLQSLLMGLPAVFVYLAARRQLDSPLAGLSFALAYLFFYLNHVVNLADYHQEAAISCFVLGAYYAWLARKTWVYWLLIALALSLKEDISLYLVPLGVVMLSRRRRGTGLATVAVCAAWLALCLYLIIPHYYGEVDYPAMSRYSWLGSSLGDKLAAPFVRPGAIIAHLFEHPDWGAVAKLAVPLGALAVLTPRGWLLVCLPLAANLLSTYSFQYRMAYHYPVTVIPFLFIGALYGAKELAARMPKGSKGGRMRRALWAWVLVGGLVGSFSYGSYNYNMRKIRVTPHIRYFYQEVLPLVPGDAAISTQERYLALFSRQEVYHFPDYRHADYVLLDRESQPWNVCGDKYEGIVSELSGSDEYCLLLAQDGYLLFRKEGARGGAPLHDVLLLSFPGELALWYSRSVCLAAL